MVASVPKAAFVLSPANTLLFKIVPTDQGPTSAATSARGALELAMSECTAVPPPLPLALSRPLPIPVPPALPSPLPMPLTLPLAVSPVCDRHRLVSVTALSESLSKLQPYWQASYGPVH